MADREDSVRKDGQRHGREVPPGAGRNERPPSDAARLLCGRTAETFPA